MFWICPKFYFDFCNVCHPFVRMAHVLIIESSVQKIMNRIIAACKQNGHNRSLLNQFNAALAADVLPRENDYRDLIFACSRKADPIGANFWFDRLVDGEFSPSAVCFESVIQSFAKRRQAGDLSQCAKWIAAMRDKDLSPNAQTMNILLSAFIKTEEKKEIVQFFNKMQIKDVVSYTCMIEYQLGVCRDESAAYKLLDAMIASNVQPNVRTYNAFLNFCARHDNAIAADVWFERIENENLTPDNATFGGLLSAHLRLGDLKSVNKYLEKMNEYAIAPEAVLVNKLVDIYAAAADFDGAVSLFERYFPDYVYSASSASSSSPPSMSEKHVLVPDIKSYTSVILAGLRSGKGPLAMKWLEVAESHGFRADQALYSAVINWYAQQGDQDTARIWFDEMIAAGIQPESSGLNAMVSKIGRTPTTWTRTGGVKNDRIQQRVEQMHGDANTAVPADFEGVEMSA